ncbi:MAG: hypothetical protein ACXAAH_09540 [Promethearchaeota archaeon]|jgi:hypothetical protein
MNYSIIEYRRQIEVIKANNLRQQRKTNKLVLITAACMFTVVCSCFILHFVGLINLS